MLWLRLFEGIGQGLAAIIFEFITTGRSSYLPQLQASQMPEETFRRVPGIGEELVRRIVQELEIDSLETLEQATHDGRLAEVEGFDWVVIYYQKDGPEAQGTVVTETQGPLKGKRVIQGRERELWIFIGSVKRPANPHRS